MKEIIPEFPHSAQFIMLSGIPLAFFSLSPKQNPQIPIGLAIFYDYKIGILIIK